MGQKRQWYYRGSLKSCNYSCSYCPFSKKSCSSKAEQTDRRQLFSFIEQLEEMQDMTGAVQIVPYGEALIHSYYWEGLARLSCHQGVEAAGAQSNFSFPVEEMLNYYLKHGGKIEKLRLWGTFHPEMTSMEAFVSQCEKLSKWKVAYSVGAVGVPSQIPMIQKLRDKLPSSVYLWVNKMDGLGRNYSEDEIEKLLEIDEYFELELKHHPADENLCGNQVFAEADGSLRRCNLCRSEGSNLYDLVPEQLTCTRRECSCYLAYNNRLGSELVFFRPYPAFRIPAYPRAVFLDIDGTILPKGQKKLSEEMKRRILRLAEHSAIYLATSLPLESALQRVHGIRQVLSGGVFASGGRCIIFQEGTGKEDCDTIAPIENSWIEKAKKMQKDYGFRLHTYQKDGQFYKVTMTFPAKKFTDMDEAEGFAKELVKALYLPDNCRWFLEDHCIEIVRSDRGKLEGIIEIMQMMGYQKEEVMAFGNSKEDEPMLACFPGYVKV